MNCSRALYVPHAWHSGLPYPRGPIARQQGPRQSSSTIRHRTVSPGSHSSLDRTPRSGAALHNKSQELQQMWASRKKRPRFRNTNHPNQLLVDEEEDGKEPSRGSSLEAEVGENEERAYFGFPDIPDTPFASQLLSPQPSLLRLQKEETQVRRGVSSDGSYLREVIKRSSQFEERLLRRETEIDSENDHPSRHDDDEGSDEEDIESTVSSPRELQLEVPSLTPASSLPLPSFPRMNSSGGGAFDNNPHEASLDLDDAPIVVGSPRDTPTIDLQAIETSVHSASNSSASSLHDVHGIVRTSPRIDSISANASDHDPIPSLELSASGSHSRGHSPIPIHSPNNGGNSFLRFIPETETSEHASHGLSLPPPPIPSTSRSIHHLDILPPTPQSESSRDHPPLPLISQDHSRPLSSLPLPPPRPNTSRRTAQKRVATARPTPSTSPANRNATTNGNSGAKRKGLFGRVKSLVHRDRGNNGHENKNSERGHRRKNSISAFFSHLGHNEKKGGFAGLFSFHNKEKGKKEDEAHSPPLPQPNSPQRTARPSPKRRLKSSRFGKARENPSKRPPIPRHMMRRFSARGGNNTGVSNQMNSNSDEPREIHHPILPYGGSNANENENSHEQSTTRSGTNTTNTDTLRTRSSTAMQEAVPSRTSEVASAIITTRHNHMERVKRQARMRRNRRNVGNYSENATIVDQLITNNYGPRLRVAPAFCPQHMDPSRRSRRHPHLHHRHHSHRPRRTPRAVSQCAICGSRDHRTKYHPRGAGSRSTRMLRPASLSQAIVEPIPSSLTRLSIPRPFPPTSSKRTLARARIIHESGRSSSRRRKREEAKRKRERERRASVSASTMFAQFPHSTLPLPTHPTTRLSRNRESHSHPRRRHSSTCPHQTPEGQSNSAPRSTRSRLRHTHSSRRPHSHRHHQMTSTTQILELLSESPHASHTPHIAHNTQNPRTSRHRRSNALSMNDFLDGWSGTAQQTSRRSRTRPSPPSPERAPPLQLRGLLRSDVDANDSISNAVRSMTPPNSAPRPLPISGPSSEDSDDPLPNDSPRLRRLPPISMLLESLEAESRDLDRLHSRFMLDRHGPSGRPSLAR